MNKSNEHNLSFRDPLLKHKEIEAFQRELLQTQKNGSCAIVDDGK